MEMKQKLINIFEKFVEKSTYGTLSREKGCFSIYDYENKCKTNLESIVKKIPDGIADGIYFSGRNCYYLEIVNIEAKDKNKGEGVIQIFPVNVTYLIYFCNYNLHKFSFFKRKRKKYNELRKIYSEAGLLKISSFKSGDSIRKYISGEYTTYAISYGQVFRELSAEEYNGLENKYLAKLCNLDVEFLESQLKK